MKNTTVLLLHPAERKKKLWEKIQSSEKKNVNTFEKINIPTWEAFVLSAWKMRKRKRDESSFRQHRLHCGGCAKIKTGEENDVFFYKKKQKNNKKDTKETGTKCLCSLQLLIFRSSLIFPEIFCLQTSAQRGASVPAGCSLGLLRSRLLKSLHKPWLQTQKALSLFQYGPCFFSFFWSVQQQMHPVTSFIRH